MLQIVGLVISEFLLTVLIPMVQLLVESYRYCRTLESLESAWISGPLVTPFLARDTGSRKLGID